MEEFNGNTIFRADIRNEFKRQLEREHLQQMRNREIEQQEKLKRLREENNMEPEESSVTLI